MGCVKMLMSCCLLTNNLPRLQLFVDELLVESRKGVRIKLLVNKQGAYDLFRMVY